MQDWPPNLTTCLFRLAVARTSRLDHNKAEKVKKHDLSKKAQEDLVAITKRATTVADATVDIAYFLAVVRAPEAATSPGQNVRVLCGSQSMLRLQLCTCSAKAWQGSLECSLATAAGTQDGNGHGLCAGLLHDSVEHGRTQPQVGGAYEQGAVPREQ